MRLNGNSILTNVNAAETVNLGGLSTIKVDSLANGPTVIGTPKNFPIIKYTTAENGTVAESMGPPILPSGYVGIVTDLNSGGENLIVLQVYTNAPTGRPAIWDGASGGDWDFTTQNWKVNNVQSTFNLLDAVLFNESLTGTSFINLTQSLLPGNVTVNNSGTPYFFSGPGKITGGGALIKQNNGTLTIDNSGVNDFSGGVLISGGTVQVGNNGMTGNLPYAANITNNAALVFARADDVAISNAISGSGSLTQMGNGALTMSGTSTYSGKTEVDSGTFVLNGTLSGGGRLTNAPGTTLMVSGTNAGPINVSGVLLPGNSNAPATMGAGNGLTFSSGATVTFDLNSTTNQGGGINDLIQVTGGLTLAGNSLSINLLGAPAVGAPYRLINFTGSRNGSFSSTVAANTHYTATLDQVTPSQINVTFGGNAANLKWNSGGDPNWDIGTSQNWSNAVSGLNPDYFFQGDSVYFNDAPGVTTTVSIPAGVSVSPTVISNNSTAGVNEFTISGPGRITGAGRLVKNGDRL